MTYIVDGLQYGAISIPKREKYTYNIRPLASNLSPEKKTKSSQKTKQVYISSDDEDDDVNQLNIGCLGLLSPQASLEANEHKVRHTEYALREGILVTRQRNPDRPLVYPT